MNARQRLIIALDVAELRDALKIVEATKEYCDIYKVGLELYLRFGAVGVQKIQDLGVEIFLDLKLHDIPNTVHSAILQLSHLRPRFVTVHASGGVQMLSAAKSALMKCQGAKPYTKLLAVSLLTHLTSKDLRMMGIMGSPSEIVSRWLRPISHDPVFGAVCSSLEVAYLRAHCPNDFALVCPGIRPVKAEQNDQSRIATPHAALHSGADYLVIGRPIIRANHPQLAARSIIHEMEFALKELNSTVN